MKCKNPLLISKLGKLAFSPVDGAFFVPCGRCLYCRIMRRNEWVIRLLCEMEDKNDNCFVTLTYNDENLPSEYSLVKKDLQLYFKRLRKRIGKKAKIKYYACGEYGENTFRPHYHFILFNYKNEKDITECWNKGHVHIGSVTMHSIRYVAQYIDKKIYGEKAKEHYGERQPEFQLQSKGLGFSYLEKNIDKMKEDLYIPLHGKKVGIPKYFKKKISEVDVSFKDKIQYMGMVKQVEDSRNIVGLHIDTDFEDMEIDDKIEYMEKILERGSLLDTDLKARLKINSLKKDKKL